MAGESRPKPGACEVHAWYKPGAWEGIGRYMGGTCEIKARSKAGNPVLSPAFAGQCTASCLLQSWFQIGTRCLGGDWEVHGRYMRDQSQIKGREPGAIPRFRGTVYRLLPFAVVVSGVLPKASGRLGHLRSEERRVG